MDSTLVVTVIGTAVTALGLIAAGAWAFNEAIKKEFEDIRLKTQNSVDVMFRRLDENKTEYYKNFVLKEVHEESRKSIIEITDQKFLSQMKLFETHLSYITNELKSINEKIK